MKILLLLLFASCAFAQDCTYTNLSKQLDFTVKAKRFEYANTSDSVDVDVTVIIKKGGRKSNVHFGTHSFYDDSYAQCGNVRSYTTGVNKDKETLNNDYGDLIVADFNFDGSDDFALKYDGWSNSGPGYNFYLQQKDGSFIKDDYLSEKVFYCPESVDASKKELTVSAISGAVGMNRRTYRYDDKNKSWGISRYERARGHNFTELSNNLDFWMAISEVEQNGNKDSVYVNVCVYDKKENFLQAIDIATDFYMMPLEYFGEGRSYTTGFNKDKEVMDNDYGNIIVADLNFDGLEDLAIKREQGGNGGPMYNFYFQDKTGRFIINQFLSTSMGYFPYKIITEEKTLVAKVRLNTYESEDIYYQYTAPPKGDGWRKLNPK
ncbi:hypothetical protein AM493_02625 [Flavobacterium akiainvivens]|uniref:VCBS repeat-containing protein n=1 Tax=Flavobacterium akiainvivens TaxID=1202724 RepID=A0A0N0RQE4_9FLAO|nr:hypothetical protein [Flavobacterium akiainvivens]KOS05049.1 hypothetical protein AM493_02625 [Flavobacterium akiainvivens]SFQ52203.1 hypothetical protein SAMN05444144_106279 [Flavobacterium akiainvivens]